MDKGPISRGFRPRRQEQTATNRLPPGQFVTDDFPVLSAGPTPRTPLEKWTLALQDGGSLAGRWTWEEFQSLPQTEITVDIHCVTKWPRPRSLDQTRFYQGHADNHRPIRSARRHHCGRALGLARSPQACDRLAGSSCASAWARASCPGSAPRAALALTTIDHALLAREQRPHDFVRLLSPIATGDTG